MAILTPDVASKLYGLDSAISSDGVGPTAHGLRELGRCSNRAISRGELVARANFDAGGVAGEGMGGDDFHGWGWSTEWVELTPKIPIRKKPFLTDYKVLSTAYLTEDSKHFLQVETRRWPFNAAASPTSPNVIQLDGDASSDTWLKDSLNLAAQLGVEDFVRFWLRSEPLAGLMSEVTYGALNTGVIDDVPTFGGAGALWELQDDDASWNTGGNTPTSGGHVLTIEDTYGNIIVPPTRVLRNTDVRLAFEPRIIAGISVEGVFAPAAAAFLVNKVYRVYKLPTFRFADLAVYAQERSP